MNIVAAPDKFRGSATAAEVADAMGAAAEAVGASCARLPLADGGEGLLAVLGGANRTTLVCGPLGEPVEAEWRLDCDVAVVEMATASGLLLAGGATGNDPMTATSRGTGELVREAISAGARRIIVGVGGSACTDGGIGAVEVLADLGPMGGEQGFQVFVAADVRTQFGAAAVQFGPQKGAHGAQLDLLTDRLAQVAAGYRRRFGIDVSSIPGGGAGGGLAGGLAALGGRIESGFELVAQQLGLAAAISAADLVLTGEGKLDAGSFRGKVVGGVLAMAHRAGVSACVIVGDVAENLDLGDHRVISLTGRYGLAASLADPQRLIRLAAGSYLSEALDRIGSGPV